MVGRERGVLRTNYGWVERDIQGNIPSLERKGEWRVEMCLRGMDGWDEGCVSYLMGSLRASLLVCVGGDGCE